MTTLSADHSPVADGTGTVELPALTDEPVIPTIEIDGRSWQPVPSAQFLGQRMVAAEQEFRAHVEENRAKVVLAEAEVPKAMAQALREGNLGVMDLYRLHNVDADTQMRKSIADGDAPPPTATS